MVTFATIFTLVKPQTATGFKLNGVETVGPVPRFALKIMARRRNKARVRFAVRFALLEIFYPVIAPKRQIGVRAADRVSFFLATPRFARAMLVF